MGDASKPLRPPQEYAGLDQVVLDSMRPIVTAVALIFSAFIIFNLVDFPAAVARYVVPYDLALVLIFVLLRWLLVRGKVPIRLANPAVALLGALVLSNILLAAWLQGEPFYLIHVALVLIGMGSFLLSNRWLGLTLALGSMSWLVVATSLLPGRQLLHHGFALFAASALSAAIHIARFRTVVRLLQARQRAEEALMARQQAETALSRSESRFKHLFGRMTSGVAICQIVEQFGAPDYDLLDANDAFLRIFDLDQENGMARPRMSMRMAAMRLPTHMDVFSRVVSSGKPARFEEHLEEQGRDLDVLVFSLDKDRFAYLVTDITERKTAERGLRESEERFRTISEQAVAGIGISQAGALRYANEALLDLLGCDAQARASLPPLAERIEEEDRERVSQSLERGEAHLEYRVRSEKGGRWVEQWSRKINYEGEPATLLVLIDIDEKKRLMGEMEESRRMESIGRLAGGVAHDFNNLLTPIITYGELALEAVAVEDALHSDLEQMLNAALRARELVAQLLAFGRRQLLRREPLDLNEGIAEISPLLRRLLRENISFVFRPASKRVVAPADRAQLDQVLVNLAVNAQDAMPDGGELSVAVEALEIDGQLSEQHPGVPTGEYALVRVSDEGEGMDAETAERAFEPFFTTKGEGQGTGLGLATVHGIVAQHEGHVRVETRPGAGSTFLIYLPLSAEDPGNVEASAEGVTTGGGETILVVEDEPAVRMLLVRALGDDYQVYASAGAEEALQLARELGTIDLVLSDVVLPKKDGPTVAAEVLELHPKARVLFMSGYAVEVTQRHGIELGDLLAKPFSVRELKLTVRRALDRRKSGTHQQVG